MLTNFTYVRPKSLEEAFKHLSSEGPRCMQAEQTSWDACGTMSLKHPRVVSLSSMKSLRGIRKSSQGGMRIGALTTIREVAGNSDVQKHYAALAQAASEVASPQLRNQGTLGGNLCQKPRCWYYRGDFHCLRKGERSVLQWRAKTPFTASLGGRAATSYIPLTRHPPLEPLALRSTSEGPRGSEACPENFHVPPAEDYRKETRP